MVFNCGIHLLDSSIDMPASSASLIRFRILRQDDTIESRI